ncbi:MAG: 6-bladed beta-propeller [Gemmatimonadota bacterium]
MSGTRPRTLFLAALAAALVAAPAAHSQQTVRLPGEDRALALRPTPVFAVGTAEGREWEMFSRVEQVAFDRADNLYVLDGGGHRVLVFDRAGRFVRQFGKKGGGPGEFQMPLGMTVQGDGTVAVADLIARSYSLFSPDGRYLRSVPFVDGYMPMAMGGGFSSHPRGGVVTAVRQAPPMTMDGRMRREVLQATPIVWQPFAAGAEPVRLFNAPTEINSQTQASEPSRGERQVSFRMSIPVFTPSVSWGMLPGGDLVVAHTPGYTLKVMRDGQPVRYIQRPVRERKVTEADRQRERERRREAMRTGEGMRVVSVGPGGGGRGQMSPEMIEQQLRDMEFAETIPAIQGLRVDGAGRIWVERTGEEWGEPGPIDVVAPDGRYLGTVTGHRLPDAFSPSGRAAYLEKDDMGVERVVVRQLPRL